MTTNWMTKKEYSIEEVLRVLPHRYPFLMVDRILDVTTPVEIRSDLPPGQLNAARAGSSVTGLKNITINEAPFQGHFPGKPIFPGVLTLEALAQTAAFVTVPFVAALSKGALPKLDVMLASFDKVRFRSPIVPGDQMKIRVVTKQVRGHIWAFDGEVVVDAKVVAEGSFMAYLMINPNGAGSGTMKKEKE